MPKRKKKIRVGVVGVGRGQSFAGGATDLVGMELVALCDTWEERLEEVGRRFGVQTYTEYGKFLEHDMDAVVLANYFHQHAPFAVRALEARLRLEHLTDLHPDLPALPVERPHTTHAFAGASALALGAGPARMRPLWIA